jgi:hypothetical protein
LLLHLCNRSKIWWLMYIEIMRNRYEHMNIWFQVKAHLLQCLNIGDNHIIRVPKTGEEFTVTLIDANHCPGSVMFLFQGGDIYCMCFFFRQCIQHAHISSSFTVMAITAREESKSNKHGCMLPLHVFTTVIFVWVNYI